MDEMLQGSKFRLTHLLLRVIQPTSGSVVKRTKHARNLSDFSEKAVALLRCCAERVCR